MESGHRYELRTVFEGTMCVGIEVLTTVLLRLPLPWEMCCVGGTVSDISEGHVAIMFRDEQSREK